MLDPLVPEPSNPLSLRAIVNNAAGDVRRHLAADGQALGRIVDTGLCGSLTLPLPLQ